MFNDKDNQDDAVTKSLVSLLGDLASNVTGTGPVFAQKGYVQQLIQVGSAAPCCSKSTPHCLLLPQATAILERASALAVPSCSAFAEHRSGVEMGTRSTWLAILHSGRCMLG